MGRPPFVRLDSCDALLKRENNGGGESETLGTLAIAFDDIVTKGFTLRRTQSCRHVRLGGPGPCIASGTAPDITYMDSYGHAFASKYCTLTSAGFLSVECSDKITFSAKSMSQPSLWDLPSRSNRAAWRADELPPIAE